MTIHLLDDFRKPTGPGKPCVVTIYGFPHADADGNMQQWIVTLTITMTCWGELMDGLRDAGGLPFSDEEHSYVLPWPFAAYQSRPATTAEAARIEREGSTVSFSRIRVRS